MKSVTITNPTGESLKFSSDKTSRYLLKKDVTGVNTLNFDHVTEVTPLRDGSRYFGSFANERIISIPFWINLINYGEVWDASGFRQKIARVLNPKNGQATAVFEISDGSTYSCLCEQDSPPALAQAGVMSSQIQGVISLVSQDPYLSKTDRNTVVLALSIGGFSLPFSLPFSLGVGGSDTVTNTGDIATPCTITINGPVMNPVIQNEATGEKIKIIRELDAGESITVDTAVPAVVFRDTGGAEVNGFGRVTYDSEFFYLQPGDNKILLADTEDLTGSTFVFQWNDRYGGI